MGERWGVTIAQGGRDYGWPSCPWFLRVAIIRNRMREWGSFGGEEDSFSFGDADAGEGRLKDGGVVIREAGARGREGDGTRSS